MNYLITGGAGFIGSHLVDRLLKDKNQITVVDGHTDKITVIDDFSHGKYSNLSLHNKLTVINTSIFSDIDFLFGDIDVVFHMAALTRPQWSIEHSYETSQTNVMGTIKVLDHCKNNGVKRIIFMSTSSIYGEQQSYPTSEETKPNSMNPYALSKLVGEEYCKLYYKLYGLEYNCIRPFNVYGSRMPLTGVWTSAVATFIDVLQNNKTLQMNGDGEQRRDFVYIDDVIDQLILMAHSEVSGEAFNCGSGTNTSINELLELISKIMDKRIIPTRIPLNFEPSNTLADIRKAQFILKWNPKISLEEGLRRTIDAI